MRNRTELLDQLHEAGSTGEKAAWLAPGNLCVMDRKLALQILDNRDQAFVDHSDFFGRLGEQAPCRADQRAIARELLRLVSSRLSLLRKRAVFHLPETSHWPDLAFAIVHETLATVLVSDRRSERIRRAFNRFVHSVVAPEKRSLWSKVTSASLMHKILSEINSKNAINDAQYGDILEFIGGWRREIGDDVALRIFMSALFSIIKSLSLSLSWAVFYFVREGGQAGDERIMIKESMRHMPIAWMLERYPKKRMLVDDIEVDETTKLLISPYLLQRLKTPGQWDEGFDTTMWSHDAKELFWIPFGHGDHKCPAASFSLAFIEFVLRNMNLSRATVTELADADKPLVSAVLRPRQFLLTSKIAA